MIFVFTCDHMNDGDVREVKRHHYICNTCGKEVRRDVVAEQRNAAHKVSGIGGGK